MDLDVGLHGQDCRVWPGQARPEWCQGLAEPPLPGQHWKASDPLRSQSLFLQFILTVRYATYFLPVLMTILFAKLSKHWHISLHAK